MGKTSGGVRNYRNKPSTLDARRKKYEYYIRRKDYDTERSYFDTSGGYVVTHKLHKQITDANKDKSDIASLMLARKGYKVYLGKEKSTVSGTKTKDGRIYESPMDIKTINTAGKYTIHAALKTAASQKAKTVVLFQGTKEMTRKYVESQIEYFKGNASKVARRRIEWVIVVGQSGNIHRHKLK